MGQSQVNSWLPEYQGQPQRLESRQEAFAVVQSSSSVKCNSVGPELVVDEENQEWI